MSFSYIGFNGRPVIGMAGIKLPLVLDSDSEKIALCNFGVFKNWYSKEEVKIHNNDKLLTLFETPLTIPYDPNIVAVYIHESCDLDIVDGFVYYNEIESYVSFVNFNVAEKLLKGILK